MDWYSLISALTAGLITYVEIDKKFPFPKKFILNLYLLSFLFIFGNALLAFLMYFAIKDVSIFDSEEVPKWLRAFLIGITYLSLVRQKFITISSKKIDHSIGIELFYRATQDWFYNKINGIVMNENDIEIDELIEKTDLNNLHNIARRLIKLNKLLDDEQRNKDNKFIEGTYNDSISDEIKKESLIIFIKDYYPEKYKALLKENGQRE